MYIALQGMEGDCGDPAANSLLFFEQLGAPALIYRNRETYTVQDEDPRLCNASKPRDAANANREEEDASAAALLFHLSQSDLLRSTARWYYPIDFHVLQPTTPRLPRLVRQICDDWTKPKKAHHQSLSQSCAPRDDNSSKSSLSSNDEGVEQQQPAETSAPPNLEVNENDQTDGDEDYSTAYQNALVDDLPVSLRDLVGAYDDDDDDELGEDQGSVKAPQQQQQQQSNHLGINYQQTMTALTPSNDRQLPDEEERSKGCPNRLNPEKKQDGGEARRDSSGYSSAPVNDEDDDDKSKETQRVMMQDDGNGGPTNAGPKIPSFKERNAAFKRAFRNNAYSVQQIFGLQLNARAHMILTGLDGTGKGVSKARQKISAYAQLDTNFVPGKERLKYGYVKGVTKKEHRRVFGLTGIKRKQTQLYDRERLNRADPAYIAPFHLPSLKSATLADVRTRGIPKYKRERHEVPGIPRDDPNAPDRFGNCLLSFPCKCGVCSTGLDRHETPIPCLLHPVGPLQDRVRLSFLQLPRGRRVGGHDEPRLNAPEELNVGDRIRQLEHCGKNPYVFIIRTDLHITVVRIIFVMPRRQIPLAENECWGAADLKRLHRIDCRTMWRSLPSYYPVDVTCHPNYGVSHLTPFKIAVAYESSNGERNIVHHLQIGSESLSVQRHAIANLQNIIEIDFSSHHPMVLWAAARSYVRPVLTLGYINKRPRIGHGASLYSIDLRSSESAMFQWSPSAEEFLPEGIHAISSIQTDWSREHCVWASSLSAGKTWELDTRMPCRAVNAWSLPHTSDQFGSVLPSTGFYGAGLLFSNPYDVGRYASIGTEYITSSCPTLSVGKCPGAFGLHLYQRPVFEARFQTRSIECTACPDLSRIGKVSVAASISLPLPDVADKVFTCGLASFRMPTENWIQVSCSSGLGHNDDGMRGVVCAVSLTNKGDIYTHAILESSASYRGSKNFDGLPVGGSAVIVPECDASSAGPWNSLRISLTNNFPVPSQSIRLSKPKPTAVRNTIDLSSIIDTQQESSMKRKSQKKHQRTFRKKRDTHNESGQVTLEKFNSRAKCNHLEVVKSKNDFRDKDDEESDPVSSFEVESDDEVAIRMLSRPSFSVASLSGVVESELILPRHLLYPTDKGLKHFQRNRNASLEDDPTSDRVWRSDLTPGILVGAWEDQDDASSDESA